MRKYDEMSCEERKEITELFSIWLRPYTNDVVLKVIEKKDNIIADDTAIILLQQLKQREEKELHTFVRNIDNLMVAYDSFKECNAHYYPTTHSDSYRDVLYDMFIA